MNDDGKVELVRLNNGAEFSLENTRDVLLNVKLTTALGSVLHVALPPGGTLRLDPACENLKVDIASGSAPGISGVL